MKCPNCKHVFKYSSLPVNHRVLKAWYATFICPNCGVLLAPKKSYTYYTNGSLTLLTGSIILYVFGFHKQSNLFFWLIFTVFFIGMFLFVYAVLTVKPEIYVENKT